MKAISHRSTKVFGALVVLAAVALTGCAATGGAVTSGAANGYTVCSGSHASRFDEREAQGRVCRPVLSLQGIY